MDGTNQHQRQITVGIVHNGHFGFENCLVCPFTGNWFKNMGASFEKRTLRIG